MYAVDENNKTRCHQTPDFFMKKISMRKKNLLFKGRTSRLVRVRGKYEKEKVYFLSMVLVYRLIVKWMCGDYEKFVNKI